jgi:predicted O-methyltransferase YrrM
MFEKYDFSDGRSQISRRSAIGSTYRKLLYEILISGKFSNVLEVGCLRGYSSIAFLQALDDGASFEYSNVDPHPKTSEINALIERCQQKEKVRILKQRSKDVISAQYDFIFLDGDHTAEGIGPELLQILDSRITTMVAHDIWIAHPEHPEYSGARLYRHVFTNHRDYYYIDDNARREEDYFQGCGLAFFTRDLMLFRRVAPYFDALCGNLR